jgi:hypothetical protein
MMVRVTSRAVLAAVAATVVVSCGDDDGETANAAFCDGAETFLDDSGALDDPGSEEARAAIAAAGELEAPEEIRADWNKLVDGAEALSDSGEADVGSSGQLSPEVEEAVQEMTAASSNVFAYLDEECDVSI